MSFVKHRSGVFQSWLQVYISVLKAETSKTQAAVILRESISDRKALSLHVADPSVDLVSTLKTDKCLLRRSSWSFDVRQKQCPLSEDLCVYTRMNYSLCHLGLLGGIRAVLPSSWVCGNEDRIVEDFGFTGGSGGFGFIIGFAASGGRGLDGGRGLVSV